MSVNSIPLASFVSGNGMLEPGSGLAPVASLPCCLRRGASRSEQPMKFEGFGLTDLRDGLDIADVVMEQRSAWCLLRVTFGTPKTHFGCWLSTVEQTSGLVRLAKFCDYHVLPGFWG